MSPTASPPQIYHPNIDLEGHVCLNILREDWKPVFDINSVIYGIIYLFYEPNANDPLNHGALLHFFPACASFAFPRALAPSLSPARTRHLHLHAALRSLGSLAEAAALMRENAAQFEANVRSSLRGGTLRIAEKSGGSKSVAFPKLL